MKKLALLFFCFLVAISLSNTLYAQSVRFGVQAGLTDITGPSGYTNNISDNGAGFGANFNFGAQARLNLPLIPITPIVFVDYHMLKGSQDISGVSLKTTQNILSAGVEAEYNVLPLPMVKPYVSIEAAYNNFGEFKIEGGGFSETVGSVSRFGGAIGIGSMITVLPVIDVDVSLKYHIFNLVGKDSGESNISAITLDAAFIF
ncbi:MAG: outer membrane beta-barrel protein [Ignavibacteriaceae bacterium]|nr:outer membrane beta-barrel protein [Ignavibacteriaceae bacterium]